MNHLCDTNIISELGRSKSNPKVAAWAEEAKIISISVITIEEIRYGLTRKSDPEV